jgi:MazG family protein
MDHREHDQAADAAAPSPVRGDGLARLQSILARLRGADGCPWDREQTLATLKPCLVEECYELLDVMAGTDCAAHAEELGDVLLQVLFQTSIREEQGAFTFDDVANQLADKLIRRHPHVFGDTAVDGTEAVLRNWERIKQAERSGAPEAHTRSALAGVPDALPALLRAQRVQTKAARVGFDWPDRTGPRDKIDEELAELDAALAAEDAPAAAAEIGDLLFSIVNLCRFLKIDAEEALRLCTSRFARRFQHVEQRAQAAGRDLRDSSLDELDAFWEEAKRTEQQPPRV